MKEIEQYKKAGLEIFKEDGYWYVTNDEFHINESFEKKPAWQDIRDLLEVEVEEIMNRIQMEKNKLNEFLKLFYPKEQKQLMDKSNEN